MFRTLFLFLLIVGASVCNASPYTWDDGRPMTDWEHHHIQDVYLGGD